MVSGDPFLKYLPSEIAASAVRLALHTLGRPSWVRHGGLSWLFSTLPHLFTLWSASPLQWSSAPATAARRWSAAQGTCTAPSVLPPPTPSKPHKKSISETSESTHPPLPSTAVLRVTTPLLSSPLPRYMRVSSRRPPMTLPP